MQQYYKTKLNKLSGSNYKEIERQVIEIFRTIKSKTKRTPYIRSKYFNKEKIFLNLFWSHLYQKHEKDRTRRLKYYNRSLDLIKNSTYTPETRENFTKKDELLHRFYGLTQNNEEFVVQIKENKRSHRKDLISIYPQ